jgi:hypothetical protein
MPRPGAALRLRSGAVAVGPLDGNEQATVRALEAALVRTAGQEPSFERLLAVGADDLAHLGGRLTHPTNLAEAMNPAGRGGGSTDAPLSHILSLRSAAMRLDPNTHAFVMATAFLTSICFALAAMQMIALAIHLFVPGAG